MTRKNIYESFKNYKDVNSRNLSKIFPKEREPVSICIEKKIYFKELTHAIVEAGKSKIYRGGQPAGDPRKQLMVRFRSCSLFQSKKTFKEKKCIT
jgi:hypothetical protein